MPPIRRAGPLPLRRRGTSYAGGSPPPLPLVAAVGFNNLTTTSVNLIGSINPLGLGATNLAPSTGWSSSISPFLNPGGTVSTVGAQTQQIVTTNAVAFEGAAALLSGTFQVGVTYTFAVWLQGATGGENIYLNWGGSSSDAAATLVTLTTGWRLYTSTWTPQVNESTAYAALSSSTAAAYTFRAAAPVVGQGVGGGVGDWYWFTWGTTPQFGAFSTPQSITPTSIPQTETVALSGLTAGTTYYFAIAAQTAGGTITSAPLSFTPQVPTVVTDATNPVQSTATPQVTVPHWKFPISFSAQNGVAVVEQDTLDEVFSNVQAIAVCPVGACPELPTFGVPQLTFGTAPLDPSSLTAAIQALEPRATESAVSQAIPNTDPNGGSWEIALTTQYAGGGA